MDGTTARLYLGGGGIHFMFMEAETGQIMRWVPPPAGRRSTCATPNADWSLFAGAAEGGVFVWPSRSSRTGRRT